MLHCAVPASELPAAVNGTVVGLASAPGDQGLPAAYRHVLNSDGEAPPLPCLGLGIVRSLDAEQGLVYLLTPLGEAELQRVNTLQVGF